MNLLKGVVSVKGKFSDFTIGIISLGCAKNLVNTEQMMFLLSEAGFNLTGEIEDEPIDLILLNTCGFIESAKSEAIDTIIKLGDMKQNMKFSGLVVAGCLPQRYKEEILTEMPEIDAVVGTGAFDNIVEVVSGVLKTTIGVNKPAQRHNQNLDTSTRNLSDNENVGVLNDRLAQFGDINKAVSEANRIISTSPIWAYLKIAEGCDNKCAYCVIPSIRGKFRSRPMENVVSEARNLVAKGIKELIIVAQDVTMYGIDLYKTGMLVELLKELCEIDGLRWIRLHYLYPDEINDNLIDFISNHDKILKYLDIPIQHINNKILSNMNRRGTGDDIRRLFRRLRERIEGVVLRTSIIAGLPGEGEREFQELYEFLREMKIERAGVFKYSPEEGSEAAEMEAPDEEVAANRTRILTDLQLSIMDEYDLSRVGSVETVLIEGHDTDDVYYGRSFAESPDIDGYILIEGKGISVNSFVEVRIVDVSGGVVRGIMVSEAVV